jgi:hypothetical protein
LPCGMPGIGDEIDGAMQHAPQFVRHSIPAISHKRRRRHRTNQSDSIYPNPRTMKLWGGGEAWIREL